MKGEAIQSQPPLDSPSIQESVAAELSPPSWPCSLCVCGLEMRSPEGSRLRGFYFRLHPLMGDERGGENTSAAPGDHYFDRDCVRSAGRRGGLRDFCVTWRDSMLIYSYSIAASAREINHMPKVCYVTACMGC